MVRLDDSGKNREFAESVGAGFPLLSDPDETVAEEYGVRGFGGFYAKRWTFYIDGDGIIRHIDKDVDTSTHGADMVKQLRLLGIVRVAE